MKKLLSIITIGIVALAMTGCGQSTPKPEPTTEAAAVDPIVGTWKLVKLSIWMGSPDDVAVMEGEDLPESYYKFDADGSGTITTDSIKQSKWKNTAPDTYLLTFTNGATGKETEVMLKISGDTMTGTETYEKSGQEYTFERN